MTRAGSTIAILIFLAGPLYGQRGRGAQTAPPATAKASAPIDLTGYWVSLVTEDWRYRMVTPEKSDYPSVPLNAEGRRVADAWDPAKDEAEGNQCKSYGAGNIIRQPGRLHITWENDGTLRVDADAGQQTRQFHFGDFQPSVGTPSWQGNSIAQWEFAGGRRGQSRGGDLKVITTGMRAGYLQKNGVPYSANAIVTEYFHVADEGNGYALLIVTTTIDDPLYLTGQYTRSTHFKKLPDATGWDPKPCIAR